MAKPDADVHGGFVLRLRWLRGDAGDDVTSITTDDGTNLYIRWDDTSNVDKSGSVWKVSGYPAALFRGPACASCAGALLHGIRLISSKGPLKCSPVLHTST